MRRCGLDEAVLGQGQMAGSCEHGNKLWGSLQFEKLVSTSEIISCLIRTVFPGVLVSQSVCLSVSLSVCLRKMIHHTLGHVWFSSDSVHEREFRQAA